LGISRGKLEEVGRQDAVCAPAVPFFARAEQPGLFYMTISAPIPDAKAERLSCTIELYRHLSVILRKQISTLQTVPTLTDEDCKQVVENVRAHHKALQTILDIEGSLAKYQRNGAGAGLSELDLASAREEIASRLSVWTAGGKG
jgi:hypothetical protein